MPKLTDAEIRHQCSVTIPSPFQEIMRHIGASADAVGEKCYVVGGLPRDCILGKPNTDLDFVCSNLDKVGDRFLRDHPDAKDITITKVSHDSGETGVVRSNFRTRIMHFHGTKIDMVEPRWERYAKTLTELRMIKPDAKESDLIKPIVEKGTFHDDAMRRDFTMNALYLGVGKDDWLHVVDLTGRGLDDLQKGVLDTPKDPDTTFDDDPTRIMRGVRFAACKNMTFSSRVTDAIPENAHQIKRIPKELMHDELMKGAKCDNYFRIMDTVGILPEVFPEVAVLKGIRQLPPHHTTDAFNHTLRMVDHLPNDSRMRIAGLLHDVGKASTDTGDGHFYKHDEVGSKIAQVMLTDHKFPKKDVDSITRLVGSHMRLHDYTNNASSNKARRNFQNKYGDIVDDLIIISRADILADHANPDEALRELDTTILQIAETKAEMGEVSKKEFKLAVNGNDLMAEGLKGVEIGQWQTKLRTMVLEGQIPNVKDPILQQLRKERRGLH